MSQRGDLIRQGHREICNTTQDQVVQSKGTCHLNPSKHLTATQLNGTSS